MTTPCRTGVGRIVWGDPTKAVPKRDQTTKQPVVREGKIVTQWTFGIAFPKAEFGRDIWPAMAAEVGTIYGAGVPGKFAWKFVDGDGVDGNGKPYSLREGYAGCYVLAVSTEAFAPPIFMWNAQRGNYDVVPPEGIKCGDFASLNLNFVCQKPKEITHTPSLYVNPVGIQLCGYGTAIVNTPDPMTMFGGVQHALPAGASATPIMPAGSPGLPVSSGLPIQPGYTPPPGMPGQAPGYPPQQPAPGYGQPPAGYPQQQQQPAPGYPPQPGNGGNSSFGYAQPPSPAAMPGQAGMPPGMPGQAGMPPGMPGQAGMPPGMPGVQPAHDYVAGISGMPAPGNGQPAMPGYPPQQPMPGQGGMPPAGYPQQQGGGYAPAMPGMPGGMPGAPGYPQR